MRGTAPSVTCSYGWGDGSSGVAPCTPGRIARSGTTSRSGWHCEERRGIHESGRHSTKRRSFPALLPPILFRFIDRLLRTREPPILFAIAQRLAKLVHAEKHHQCLPHDGRPGRGVPVRPPPTMPSRNKLIKGAEKPTWNTQRYKRLTFTHRQTLLHQAARYNQRSSVIPADHQKNHDPARVRTSHYAEHRLRRQQPATVPPRPQPRGRTRPQSSRDTPARSTREAPPHARREPRHFLRPEEVPQPPQP